MLYKNSCYNDILSRTNCKQVPMKSGEFIQTEST